MLRRFKQMCGCDGPSPLNSLLCHIPSWSPFPHHPPAPPTHTFFRDPGQGKNLFTDFFLMEYIHTAMKFLSVCHFTLTGFYLEFNDNSMFFTSWDRCIFPYGIPTSGNETLENKMYQWNVCILLIGISDLCCAFQDKYKIDTCIQNAVYVRAYWTMTWTEPYLKIIHWAGCQWLTPVILTAWEAEIRKMTVWGQLRQIVHKTQSPGGVALQMQTSWVQTPVPPKKKKKKKFIHSSLSLAS
jgi:hypothetical protein